MGLPSEVVSQFPEEVRTEKSWEKFDDIGSFAKSYVEMEKYAGGAIRIPGENASPEEIDRFQMKLGRPESAERYDIGDPDPAKLPKGLEWSDDSKKALRELSFHLGLSSKQAQGLQDAYMEHIGGVFSKGAIVPAVSQEDAVKQLQETWKADYPKKLESARSAVEKIEKEYLPGYKEWLEATGIGNHPVFAMLHAEFGRLAAEDKMSGRASGGDNADSIQGEINSIMTNASSPWHARWKDGDQAAVDYVSALYQRLSKLSGK